MERQVINPCKWQDEFAFDNLETVLRGAEMNLSNISCAIIGEDAPDERGVKSCGMFF